MIRVADKNEIPILIDAAESWSNLYDVKFNDIAFRESFNTAEAVFIAEEGDDLVGVCPVQCGFDYGSDRLSAMETFFIIHPAYRTQGVCVQMELEIIDWARRKGCKHFFVTFNEYASRDYKAHAQSQEKRGYKLHGVIMRKDIL